MEQAALSNASKRNGEAWNIAPLRGRWLVLARVAWIILTILVVGMWCIAIPIRYNQLQTACTSTICGDQQPTMASAIHLMANGISLTFYGIYTGTVEVIFTFIYIVLTIRVREKPLAEFREPGTRRDQQVSPRVEESELAQMKALRRGEWCAQATAPSSRSWGQMLVRVVQ